MTKKTPLVIGVFLHKKDALNALKALENIGFTRDQLGFALHEGGPVTHSLLQDLVNLGVSEDRGRYYENEYEAGRPVVSVRTDGREQEAADILQQYGAYDQDTQQRTTGQTPTSMSTGTRDTDEANADGISDEDHALHLRAERLRVDKQNVQRGEVQLHKEVVEEPQTIDVPVNHEEVLIQHRPISDGRLSDTPIGQDEIIRIPVLEEQITVNKVVVETGEVAVGKRMVQETQHVTDTVRHEEARLEKDGNPRIHAGENLLNP
jgi:uncharacterized protein (TIGR02271 family)